MGFLPETNATREELEAYIGIKAKNSFYSKALDKYFTNPNKPIWCWPAFFPNMFWLCYRKCLTPSILLMVVFFTCNLMIPSNFSVPIIMLVFVLMGMFGTNIYFITAEKEIERIKENNVNYGKKKVMEIITLKGGVSLNYALTFYVAQVMLYFVVIGFGTK